MRTIQRRNWLIALSCFVIVGQPGRSSAVEAGSASAAVAGVDETPAATEKEKDKGGLEEIVVTARKREESLLRAPVVVTVIPQESIDQYATYDIGTLTSRVPGLVIGNETAVLGPQISLRGIGTTTINATVDQSVSLNVDGLQLSQGFAYQAALFDSGQIEVLKGPQALFFGKNSPAGVISLRSADPTDETEVIARAGYEATAQEKLGELILSGPVTPALKLRLAVHYSTDLGAFENRDEVPPGETGALTPTTRDYAADENLIVRGTALFNPSDVYDARVKLNFTHDFIDYGTSGDTQFMNCPGGLVSFTGLPVFDPNQECHLSRNFYISWFNPQNWPDVGHDGIPFTSSSQEFGTVEQNLHLGSLTLTSLSGYYAYRQNVLGNGSESSALIALALANSFYNREFTEEVRLASNFHGPLNFMAGAYYQDGLMQNQPLIYGATIIGFPAVLQDAIHDIDIQSISGFGQAIWNVTDQVEFDAGARVTHEKRDHTEDNFDTVSGPLGPVPLLDPHISSTNVSPEATLSYRPTDDMTIFGSFKEGFKSGSFNTVTYIGSTTPASFGDEKVKGGEVGLKTRMLDRTLSLNLAAYYYHYTGLQVGANTITPSGALALYTLNAAAANTKGIDADATYAPPQVKGFTLRGALNYNIARYSSFPNAPCANNQTISEGCNQMYDAVSGAYTAQDLAGRPLVRAPDWVATTGFDYERPVGENMAITMGGYVTYTSSYYTALVDEPGFIQPSFAKLSANVALKGANNAWDLALIGNNLTNKITTGFCFNSNANGLQVFGGQVSGKATGGPAGDDYAACGPDEPRTVWVRLTVRPGAFMHH